MGEPRFAFPTSLGEAIGLLNDLDLGKVWSLSVFERDGVLYVYGGDQVMFVARSRPEVMAFLAGIFLSSFEGRSLDELRKERAQRNVPLDQELDEIRAGLAHHGNLQLID